MIDLTVVPKRSSKKMDFGPSTKVDPFQCERARGCFLRAIARHIKPGMPTECWPWKGHRSVQGYGMIWYTSKLKENGKTSQSRMFAHRAVWFLAFGPVPPGMCVCHKCDNPPCCNPNHLFLGTSADNTKDRSRKGRTHRQNWTHCARGHEYNEENTLYCRNGKRYCRACSRIRDRKRYPKRREKHIAYMKAWYLKHKNAKNA